MNKEQTRIKFYVEAAVGVAKSSIFLTSAEAEVERNEFISATISAYYSIFHISLSLMWLFADQLPQKVLNVITDLRDKGAELPSSEVSHSSVENFLCSGQLKLKDITLLCNLFRRARELREFANYGPRVTYSHDQPIVGPCYLTIYDAKELVNKIRPTYINVIKAAAPNTALNGTLAPIVLDQALDLMNRSEFPFIKWSSRNIHAEAMELLKQLHEEVLRERTI